MKSLLAAVQFLTCLPVPKVTLSEKDLAAAPAWYGIVGLGLGGVLAGMNLGLMGWVPVAPRIMMVLLASFLLTGGLHLDGLADCADGLLGSRDRERSLVIMRDSRIGTFGTVALIAVLGLQWSALAELPGTAQTMALLLGPGLARAGLLVGAVKAAPARLGGLGAWFLPTVTPLRVLCSGLPVIAVALWMAPQVGLWCCLAAPAAALLARRWFVRRLGGQTGDTLGGTLVLIEALTSLIFHFARTG